MTMPTTMINSRSSSLDLDGRRPTAGGMPSYQQGNNNYTYWYERAHKYYYRNYHWDTAKWRQEILECAEAHYTYGRHEGWMACLWDMFQQQTDRENHRTTVDAARDKLNRDLGPREFTLTFSPAWYADNESAKDAMRVAIDKLTRYYKHDIIEFHAIGEYTEAGRPHVHCYYHLEGGVKITDKNFKRSWPHWNPRKKLGSGHQGGHHANIRSKSDFLGYIEKDLDAAWMNVYITKDASGNMGSRSESASVNSSTRSSQDSSSSDEKEA